MHIPDGVLSDSATGLAVLGLGWLGTAAGTAWALRQIDYDRLPRVALLSAAFFIACLIRVPVGPGWAHLVLNGLLGLVLGWAAFPAILIALLLQAVYLQFGGITTLGVNTLVMALPAVGCHYLLRSGAKGGREPVVLAAGMAAGALGVLLGALLEGAAWLSAGPSFQSVGVLTVLGQLPVAAADAAVAGAAVVFLRKVRPELLEAPLLAPATS